VASPDAAFVDLLFTHQHLVHKVCRVYCPVEEDRRDLFQEIALQLWRAYPQFKGEAKITTWIYRIALNVAISGLRKTKDPPARLSEAMYQIPDDQAPEPDRLDMLYQAMYVLTDIEKALLLLYFEDKTMDEIADLTGITANNVRVKMHRIREKLKRLVAVGAPEP
jgi:RNA polymerase sigma factor (sigma-70 family)